MQAKCDMRLVKRGRLVNNASAKNALCAPGFGQRCSVRSRWLHGCNLQARNPYIVVCDFPRFRRWQCGVDDPIYAKELKEIVAARVPQVYETADSVQRARRLNPQSYSDSANFVPITDADEAGDTAPMRIVALWDTVDAGDPNGSGNTPRQCSSVGE
jgi:hypothetical protein